MLLLAPALGLLPNAVLAAIVIVYSVGLIQPAEFRAIRGVRTMEFRWALVACAGVLVFGTLQGIVVAIIVSMVGLASQTANPRVSVIGRKRGADVLRPLSGEHPDDETFEGLLIVRPEGRLFFVNARNVGEQIEALVAAARAARAGARHEPRARHRILGAAALIEGEKKMAERGVTLWLAGLNPSVLEVVRHAGLRPAAGRRAHVLQRPCGDRAPSGASRPRATPDRYAGLKRGSTMAEIKPRWEWRSFGERFGPAEAHVASLSPSGVQESDELYLLSGAGAQRQGARCADGHQGAARGQCRRARAVDAGA